MYCLRWVCRWTAPVPPYAFHLAHGQPRKKSPKPRRHSSGSRSERKTRANMRLLRQLEFAFEQFATRVFTARNVVVGQAHRLPCRETATDTLAPQSCGRDANLETKARELLRSLGANRIAKEIRIEWNPRLKTTAGRA